MKKLYVACSMSMFATMQYDTYLARIKADYPEHEILEPKLLYHCHTEWLEGWKDLKPLLSLFIFFRDTEDYIGLGVVTEMIGLRCPILLLTDSGYVTPDNYNFKLGPDNRQHIRVTLKKKRTPKIRG